MFSTQTSNLEDKRRPLSFNDDAAGSSETVDSGDDGDATLEDVAERERDYLRQRLREELKREPTEEELNEWLREHTEGY
jgi:hypothetical protein